MHEYRIHSMHGPTVHWGTDLEAMMAVLARLNTPAANGGRYTLIATVYGREYEILPMGMTHTHGYRTFCERCHRDGVTQRTNPQPGDTLWP